MDSAGAFGFIMISFLFFGVFAGLIFNYNHLADKEFSFLKDNIDRFESFSRKIVFSKVYSDGIRTGLIFRNVGSSPYRIKDCFTLFLNGSFYNNFSIFPLNGGSGDYSYIMPEEEGILLLNVSKFDSLRVISCYGGNFFINYSEWDDFNYSDRVFFNVRNPSNSELEEFQVPVRFSKRDFVKDLDKGSFFVDLKSYLGFYFSFDGSVNDISDRSVSYLGVSQSIDSSDPEVVSDGVIGSSLRFDGSDDLVTVKNGYFTNFSKEVTFSAWFKRNLTGGDSLQNIVTYRGWQNAIRIVNDGSVNDGKLLFQLNIDGSVRYLYSKSVFNDSRWHFVSATYDGLVMKLFVDGVLESSFNVKGEFIGLSSSADSFIGAESSFGYHFKGQIDEVSVFSVALNSYEINFLKRGIIIHRKVPFYILSSNDGSVNNGLMYVKVPFIQASLINSSLNKINVKRVVHFTLNGNLKDFSVSDEVDDKLFFKNGSKFVTDGSLEGVFLNGSNSLFFINSSEADLVGLNSFAVNLQFKAENVGVNNKYLLYKDKEFFIYIDNSGFLNWALFTSSNSSLSVHKSNLRVVSGEFYSLIFNYDGSSVTLFLNSSSESWSYSGVVSHDVGSIVSEFFIGSNPHDSYLSNFRGKIYSFSLMNDSLSSDEVVYFLNESKDSKFVRLLFYYGGGSVINSDMVKTFTYKKERVVGYLVNDRLASVGLNILSLGDNNVVKIGSSVKNYDFFDSDVISSGLSKNSSIMMSNLTEIIGIGNGADIFVPISWAGKEFAYAGFRGVVDRLCMLSPFGSANVKIYNGGNLLDSVSIDSSGSCLDYSITGKLFIKSDIPILVSYRGSSNIDVFSMLSLRDNVIYGIPSNSFYLAGVNKSQKYNVFKSNGDVIQGSLSPTGYYSLGGNGADGTAPGFKVVGSNFISAIQQADTDGVESTIFVPFSEMGYLYGASVGIQYVVLVSPFEFANCSLYNQNGVLVKNQFRGVGRNGVYKYEFDPNDNTYISGKWFVKCDMPVWGYFEEDSSSDEKNFISYLQMRQYVYPEVYIIE